MTEPNPTRAHRPVEGSDFMPPSWCGGCNACPPAPKVCLACSYSPDGMPAEPAVWPCVPYAESLIAEQAPSGPCAPRAWGCGYPDCECDRDHPCARLAAETETP